MALARSTTAFNGRVTRRLMNRAITKPSPSTNNVPTAMATSMVCESLASAAASWLASRSCEARISAKTPMMAAALGAALVPSQ